VSDPAYVNAVIKIKFNEEKKIPFQPHPNVDKKQFTQSREIALKGGKAYKLNDDLCVVRYRCVSRCAVTPQCFSLSLSMRSASLSRASYTMTSTKLLAFRVMQRF
jgi:hypothetical protein